jgi:hypothetical protein
VISRASRRFWSCFDALPQAIQKQAREKYRIWRRDPFHPSLHFKEIIPDLWSARITSKYRAGAAARRGGGVVLDWAT